MKRMLVCVLLSGLAAGFAAPSHADNPVGMTLPQVLQKHLQALGSAQALALSGKTQRTQGTEEVGGLHGTFVQISRGMREWQETKLGIYDEISGSDDKTFWQRDTNGSVRLLSPEELKTARLGRYLGTYSYLFPDRLPGKVTLRPQTEDKTGDYVLDVVPQDGKPAALYLDPKTFLCVKEVHFEETTSVTTTFRDFKPLAGVMTATQQRIGDKKYGEVLHTDTVETIADVGDSLFTAPQSVKNYQWLQQGKTSADVALDTSDHRINLYVGLNGLPAYIFLDSGNGGFILDLRAADLLKLKHQGTLEVSGYGGTADAYPFSLDTLEVPGGIAFSSLSGRAVDADRLDATMPVTATVGAIGYDLLSRLVTRVDIAGATLSLFDPDAWKPGPQDGSAVPMELDSNIPSVLAQIDGLPPARFLIDTGDPTTVELYASYVKANKLDAKYPKAISTHGAGVGGSYAAKEARLQSLTLGGVTMTSIPARLSLDSKGGGFASLAGAIGMEVLERFTFTFDYRGKRMFFKPNADAAKPFDTRTFGVTVIELPDNTRKNKTHFLLAGVNHKTEAYDRGLEAGMELLKVDEKTVKDLGLAEVRRVLSPEGGQDRHTLTVRNIDGTHATYKVSLFDQLPPH